MFRAVKMSSQPCYEITSAPVVSQRYNGKVPERESSQRYRPYG
jgi:hypothetical protein